MMEGAQELPFAICRLASYRLAWYVAYPHKYWDVVATSPGGQFSLLHGVNRTELVLPNSLWLRTGNLYAAFNSARVCRNCKTWLRLITPAISPFAITGNWFTSSLTISSNT